MRCGLLFLWCYFTSALLFAQSVGTGTIQGTVIDSTTRQAVREAAVSLLQAKDSSFVTYTITGGEGNFSFTKIPFGQYRLLITFLGYKNSSTLVTLTPDNPLVDLNNLLLVQTSIELREVTVLQERAPIIIKSDTVEFNAGSFKTKPNAQVEELLKKLPGIEVSRDGTVTAQGEEVKRILVDGKPFFGDDPKVATRNLPAEIIENIQVFNQQSDQSSFSGFDDGSREKTINLTTKKDKRKGVFGQNSLGIGTKSRYQGKLNVNRFNDKQQVSLIGLANNINQQGFTIQDMFNFGAASNSSQNGFYGGGDTPGGMGETVSVMPGGRFNGGGNNGANANAITESWAGGLNFRDTWGKKIDITGSYFLNRSAVATKQTSVRQTMLPDTSFLNHQENQSDNVTTGHRLNLRVDYQIDSLNSIRITPGFTWQQAKFTNFSHSRAFTSDNLPLNQSDLQNQANGVGIYGTNNLLYKHKFRKKGRTFSLNLQTVVNNQDRDGINKSENLFFNASPGQAIGRSFNQKANQASTSVSNTVNVSYTEPLSIRKTLEFHYVVGNNTSTNTKDVNDYSELSGNYDQVNDQLSNRFSNGFMTQRGGVALQTRRLKYTYALGLDLQKTDVDSRNLSKENSLSKHYVNLLPNALFTYNFGSNRTLRINFRSRINAPSISQLQPVPDNTNPLVILEGNPDLKPEYMNTVMAMYNQFNPSNSRSTIGVVNLSQTFNKISTAARISPDGLQNTSFINTNSYVQANGFMSVSRRIRPLKSSISFNSTISYTTGQSFINNQANQAKRMLVGQGVVLTSTLSQAFDFSISGKINYQRAGYSLQRTQNTSFFNKTLSLDLFYQLPCHFAFTTEVTYNNTSGRSAAYNQNFILWNMGIGRQFFKQKQGEVKLSVYDLLNQNRSIVRNTSDTYIEDVQSHVLQPYVMLSFTYNLRKFGGNSVFAPSRSGLSPLNTRQK
ncbi:outer membrane beta-barrel family protein [Rhodocytophaga aerolata]|uniref:Outer membrane beta-barrel family protein n=1 Tax=Rhodocytophaga aerolata TaxID=455078 RepID=A0ABT8R967_9BACT|nr:outer membrane beta-barrel family protein [Rhodocytophaga aerolata]MDO1448637.1 outer membrane beta-barrel family protein [Rhodocytophaga aerolata]